MNNKSHLLFLLLSCLTQEAFCPILGVFPGVDYLIDSSDAILVIHITKTTGKEEIRQTFVEYDVFVERTLKGDVPERHSAKLFLRYLPLGLTTGGLLRVGSRQVVFLVKPRPESNNLYSNLNCEGSHLELSTHGNVLDLNTANLKKTVIELFQTSHDFHQTQADAIKRVLQNKTP